MTSLGSILRISIACPIFFNVHRLSACYIKSHKLVHAVENPLQHVLIILDLNPKKIFKDGDCHELIIYCCLIDGVRCTRPRRTRSGATTSISAGVWTPAVFEEPCYSSSPAAGRAAAPSSPPFCAGCRRCAKPSRSRRRSDFIPGEICSKLRHPHAVSGAYGMYDLSLFNMKLINGVARIIILQRGTKVSHVLHKENPTLF